MADEASVLEFVGTNFRSVWAMEVLCFLVERRADPPRADDLISEMRVSSGVVVQSLGQLNAVALIDVDVDGKIRLRPQHAPLIDAAVALYARRPDLVRRTIVSRTSPGIAAFADAFKLRKD